MTGCYQGWDDETEVRHLCGVPKTLEELLIETKSNGRLLIALEVAKNRHEVYHVYKRATTWRSIAVQLGQTDEAEEASAFITKALERMEHVPPSRIYTP